MELINQNPRPESLERHKPKVLFIDDSADILSLFSDIAPNNPRVVTAECHSLEDARQAIAATSPDILFLDNSFSLNKGEDNAGLKLVTELLRRAPEIKIYSTTSDSNMAEEYEKIGIKHIKKFDIPRMEAIINSNEDPGEK
ncbi:MAG: response regulator [Patescibacteria group bacterium]|nr:response regulator [Patescibacteria group bacterium]